MSFVSGRSMATNLSSVILAGIFTVIFLTYTDLCLA